MRKTILICLILCTLTSFGQDKLLTKKIIYTINLTENSVKSSEKGDSVLYEYLVNKRFWWNAIDFLLDEAQHKRLALHNQRGDTITWDSMINGLNKNYKLAFGKELKKKETQNLLENAIRKITFEEEWTYDPATMLINKKVLAYCPIISIDSVALCGEDLASKECFSYPIGWIYPTVSTNKDTTLICRDIRYTMPIYNYEPYRWWDSNLEAEYSIPYFENFIQKAESGELPVYEDPDLVDELKRSEISKRREYTKMETIVKPLQDNNVSEQDTIIKLKYYSENIEYLRFGEEIYFDKSSRNFLKKCNYVAPVLRMFSSDGNFIGYYPMYYVRKK